jgi:hypothetical protein
MAYDIVAPLPFYTTSLESPIAERNPDDTTSIALYADLPPRLERQNSLLLKCKECKTCWIDNEIPIIKDRPDFSGSPALYCPKCNHEINPTGNTTRWINTNYSSGPGLKVWDDGVSIVRSEAQYTVVHRRKRIPKAALNTIKPSEVFSNKGRHYNRTAFLAISKRQTLHVLNVNKRGIFSKTIITFDGRIFRDKKSPTDGIRNITYKPNTVHNKMKVIFNEFFVPQEEGIRHALLPEFLQEVEKLLGVKISSPTDICQVMFERFRPVLKDIRFNIEDLSVFKELGILRDEWISRRSRWIETGRKGKEPTLPTAPIMKLSKKSSIRDAILAIIEHPLQRSVLKTIAEQPGEYLNWPLIFAIIYGVKDPNHTCRILRNVRICSKSSRDKDLANINQLHSLADVIEAVLQTRGINHLQRFLCRIFGQNPPDLITPQAPQPYRIGVISGDIIRMCSDQQLGLGETCHEILSNAYRAYSVEIDTPDLHGFHNWIANLRNRLWEERRNRLRQEELKRLNEPLTIAKKYKFLATEHKEHKFILPEKGLDLNDWGVAMHNCIGGYANKMYEGKTLLIAVINKDGKMVANIQIGHSLGFTSDSGELYTKQVRGFCNASLLRQEEKDKEADRAITEWLSRHNITMRDT